MNEMLPAPIVGAGSFLFTISTTTMRKSLLFLVAFATALGVYAQTDVTSKYLTNASFEDDATSNVGKVWKQLVEDFPFLKRNITGTARDLGPYERPGDATGIISVAGGNPADKGVRKYLSNGRIVILKNGQRYNLQGQKLYQK